MENGEGSAHPLFSGIPRREFGLKQSCDKALRHTFDQVRLIDGKNIQPKAIILIYFHYERL